MRAPAWPAVARGLVVPVVLVAAGCGYQLQGRGAGVLPDGVRAIAVTPFDNRTTRPEIEQRVTEEVARELSQRGGYRVVGSGSEADAVLEGAVTEYRTTPVQISSTTGRRSRVEAVVTLEAMVRDVDSDEVLWRQTGLVFREQFDVPDTGEFFDQETVALDEIARGAAGLLVTSIIEGF